ncbi:MAG: hypothetical protein ABI955_00230 [Nitrospirota bacterium]
MTIGKLVKIRAAGRGGIMEQIAKIGAYITVPDCATTGTVRNIKEGRGDAIGQDPMLVYEIETDQDMVHIPADWLARLIKPA